MSNLLNPKLGKAAEYLQPLLAKRPRPEVLVICGSGLSHLSESVDPQTKLVVPYGDIPGFPQVGVAGHAGEMVFGQIGGIECMILRGRFHSYEGHPMDDCVLPVRLGHTLGCGIMIVTNACGGISRQLQIGDICTITDHIGIPLLAGKGPLVGPNDPVLGPRFPAMSNAYDEKLRALVLRAAKDLGMTSFVKSKATYAFVSGPAYETPSESAMLRMLGADVVGMSTVPEVVAAKHCGMRILGLSLVTNKVVLPGDVAPVHATHEEVLATTATRTKDIQGLVETVLRMVKANDAAADMVTSHIEAPVIVPSATTGNENKLKSVEAKLKAIDLATLTPMDAMRVLRDLKSLVDQQ